MRLPFSFCEIKNVRWRLHRYSYRMMFSRLFQLATSLGIGRPVLVRSGVDPSFYFHVYWVFIYLLIYLPALSHHPLYACIAFYVAYLLLSYTGWAAVQVVLFIWVGVTGGK